MCRAGGEAAQGLTMRGTQTIIYYNRSSLSGGAPVAGLRYLSVPRGGRLSVLITFCRLRGPRALRIGLGGTINISCFPLIVLRISSHGRCRFPNILSLLTAGGPARSVCGPSVGPEMGPQVSGAVRSAQTQPGGGHQIIESSLLHKVQ